MSTKLKKMIEGYETFRNKYAEGDSSIMRSLSLNGQKPEIMVVACCDSRVDPALILQCDPGDLFVIRNVANIVPPYENDDTHHGTSAALEFAICYLKVKHLIILGHSQCGGIQTLCNADPIPNDFITNWVSVVKTSLCHHQHPDDYSKLALHTSYENCMTFPWLTEALEKDDLMIHRWFFDIEAGQIFTFSEESKAYEPLTQNSRC